jgi:hypothetical protein
MYTHCFPLYISILDIQHLHMDLSNMYKNINKRLNIIMTYLHNQTRSAFTLLKQIQKKKSFKNTIFNSGFEYCFEFGSLVTSHTHMKWHLHKNKNKPYQEVYMLILFWKFYIHILFISRLLFILNLNWNFKLWSSLYICCVIYMKDSFSVLKYALFLCTYLNVILTLQNWS